MFEPNMPLSQHWFLWSDLTDHRNWWLPLHNWKQWSLPDYPRYCRTLSMSVIHDIQLLHLVRTSWRPVWDQWWNHSCNIRGNEWLLLSGDRWYHRCAPRGICLWYRGLGWRKDIHHNLLSWIQEPMHWDSNHCLQANSICRSYLHAQTADVSLRVGYHRCGCQSYSCRLW